MNGRHDQLEQQVIDALRRAPGPEPSAELDARIRARAHAALRPARRTQPRWFGLAAGLVVLVGSGLALRIWQQVERAPTALERPPASAPEAPPAAPAPPQDSAPEAKAELAPGTESARAKEFAGASRAAPAAQALQDSMRGPASAAATAVVPELSAARPFPAQEAPEGAAAVDAPVLADAAAREEPAAADAAMRQAPADPEASAAKVVRQQAASPFPAEPPASLAPAAPPPAVATAPAAQPGALAGPAAGARAASGEHGVAGRDQSAVTGPHDDLAKSTREDDSAPADAFEELLGRLREARRRGDDGEATRLLGELRRLHPQRELPEDLAAWAESQR